MLRFIRINFVKGWGAEYRFVETIQIYQIFFIQSNLVKSFPLGPNNFEYTVLDRSTFEQSIKVNR